MWLVGGRRQFIDWVQRVELTIRSRAVKRLGPLDVSVGVEWVLCGAAPAELLRSRTVDVADIEWVGALHLRCGGLQRDVTRRILGR